MRAVLALVFLLLVAVPVALIALVVAALEDRPAVSRTVDITPEQIARGKRILAAHDPRTARAGALRTFAISGPDLESGLNALIVPRGGAAEVRLAPGTMVLRTTLRLPPNPFGAFLNVEAHARQTSALPIFERFVIGRIAVPEPIANWLLARALERLNATEAGAAAADSLQAVRVYADLLQLEYRWRDDLPERLRSAVLAPADQERLRAHQERLAQVTADPKLPRQVSLGVLLRPLLEHAAARSAQSDPAAENRAAILVLAFYVNGRGLAAVVPSARDWPRPTPRQVTLSARTDFAQHFTISAALAATVGTPLSDAVGLYKEVDDSRGGSGFSFTDIAADRAGTVFGEYATRSPASAQALQRRFATRAYEAEFMPVATDLPEMMPEAEFKRRFGGVGEPRYRAVIAQIERRIAALALYR